MSLRSAACALAILATPAGAETDFTALTPAERQVFHAEIGAVLREHPDLVRPSPAPSAYNSEIARDLDLIAVHAGALFDVDLPGYGPDTAGSKIALIVGPDCPDCPRAKADLEALASTHDLRVFLIDTATHGELVNRLGVDMLPFYVLPKMMLRGHLPPTVLERYLTSGTGQ